MAKTKKKTPDKITIPSDKQELAQEFLKGLGFDDKETKTILTSVTRKYISKIRAKIMKEEMEKKFTNLPLLKINKCPCPHGSCSKNFIEGTTINICGSFITIIGNSFPEVFTTGANVTAVLA